MEVGARVFASGDFHQRDLALGRQKRISHCRGCESQHSHELLSRLLSGQVYSTSLRISLGKVCGRKNSRLFIFEMQNIHSDDGAESIVQTSGHTGSNPVAAEGARSSSNSVERTNRSGGKNSVAPQQSLRAKSVTYVLGTFCYPCLRAGQS